MARNVYTVRVVEVNDIALGETVTPVPIGHQFIITAINATSLPTSPNWTSYGNPVEIINLTTGHWLWIVPPIAAVNVTLAWRGRYVLEYGESLNVAAGGWAIAMTAYDLMLP